MGSWCRRPGRLRSKGAPMPANRKNGAARTPLAGRERVVCDVSVRHVFAAIIPRIFDLSNRIRPEVPPDQCCVLTHSGRAVPRI